MVFLKIRIPGKHGEASPRSLHEFEPFFNKHNPSLSRDLFVQSWPKMKHMLLLEKQGDCRVITMSRVMHLWRDDSNLE